MPHTLIAPSAMLAFEADRVTPRLTTAEAVTQVLEADARQRAGQETGFEAAWIEPSGEKPARRYAVVFEYSDRPPLRFEPHSVGA